MPARELEAIAEANSSTSPSSAGSVPARPRSAFLPPHLSDLSVSAALNRLTALNPSMASRYVLQLQQQYGNRYVQRQMATAQRQAGEQQIVSGNASGTASTRDGGAPASPSTPSETCEQFPGGSTDCEVDEKTGTPTGKVTHHVDETNPCTKPCVEEHEAVHVRQLRTFCPTLRDCYLAADKGKRPASDCVKMAMFEGSQRECEAYKVSVPCMEKRLRNEKSCQSKENKEYGKRKLTSERCFHDKYCGAAGAK